VAGISRNLKIIIAGLPEGVRAAVFDERKAAADPGRELINSTANSEGIIESSVPRSLGGISVKVVIRCAGFLPYEYIGQLEPGIGLFHAAQLEVDHVYSGNASAIPPSWDSAQEHRRAEEKIQHLHRQFRKDNRRARCIKNTLDWGGPLVGAIIGLPFGIYGAIVGLVVGYALAYAASRYALRAMGLD
jgi:hypothetical protein